MKKTRLRPLFRKAISILIPLLMLAATVPRSEWHVQGAGRYDSPYFSEIRNSKLETAGELIVKYRDNAGDKRYSLFESGEFELVTDIPKLNAAAVNYSGNGKGGLDINAVLIKYSDIIEDIEENYYARSAYVPDDTLYKSNQSTLSLMNIEKAWDISRGSDVVVAVLDSGVTMSHPDMRGRFYGISYDFLNRKTSVDDDTGHGTLVAGLIGSTGNNGQGIAGINWNVKIMPVKVLDKSGKGPHDVVAAGIIYAADNGARIINMSFVSDYPSFVLKDAIDYAYNKGVILVAAAGNDGKQAVSYPARYENVIAVGSGSSQGRFTYSNYGPGLTTLALGTQYSTALNGGYSTCAGTSFAAPIVSGILSLAVGIYPELTPDDAMMIVENSSIDLGASGYDNLTGWGFIDLALVLSEARAMAQKTAPEAAPSQPPASVPETAPDQAPAPSPVISDDEVFTGRIGDKSSPQSVSHEIYVGTAGSLDVKASWASNGQARLIVKDKLGNALAVTEYSSLPDPVSVKILSPGCYSVVIEALAMNNTIKYTMSVGHRS